jgi:hypothetical protein
MKPIIIAAATAALLAGCSGQSEENAGEKVAVKEAAKQAEAQGMKPQPGLYKTTITMTGLEIPGLPEGMEGHGAGLARTVESCLTQEEVDQGFDGLLKKGQDGECSFERFSLEGSALDAVLVCDAQGRTTRMDMKGTLSATTAEMEATTAIAFDGVGEGSMQFTAKHERIGDCPAK